MCLAQLQVRQASMREERSNEMSDDLVKEIAELKRKLAALEARLPKEEKPFVPKPMPTFDPTEGMSMSGSAAKAMVDLVNPKNVPKFDPSAWARNSYPQPGGFGRPRGAQWPRQERKPNPPVKHETYDSQRDGLWSKPK
jgi:hypothetical protein